MDEQNKNDGYKSEDDEKTSSMSSDEDLSDPSANSSDVEETSRITPQATQDCTMTLENLSFTLMAEVEKDFARLKEDLNAVPKNPPSYLDDKRFPLTLEYLTILMMAVMEKELARLRALVESLTNATRLQQTDSSTSDSDEEDVENFPNNKK